jgi:hypothetical protein
VFDVFLDFDEATTDLDPWASVECSQEAVARYARRAEMVPNAMDLVQSVGSDVWSVYPDDVVLVLADSDVEVRRPTEIDLTVAHIDAVSNGHRFEEMPGSSRT